MMVKDFMKTVTVRLGDEALITYSTKELMSYLNDAITQLSLERIASNDMTMTSEKRIVPGSSAIPRGFVKFVGQESVFSKNNKFFALDGSDTPRMVRFYETKAHVETKGDEIPFDDTSSLGILLNYVVLAASARVGDPASVEAELAQRMSASYLGRTSQNASQSEEA